MGEPTQVQPAAQFEQDQSEGNIDEDRQLAKHGLVEQPESARPQHQSRRNEAGNAWQPEDAHENLPDRKPA